MSLAIMSAMETSLYTALAMAVILIVIAFAVLLLFRGLAKDDPMA
jgi:ABC-type sulfate transport system permease component